VIYCFFDDSGKESASDNDFVIMAGLMTNYWEMFDVRWQQLLLKYEIPAIHIKEAVSMAKNKGWDIPRLRAVLREFSATVRESNLVGIGVGVHIKIFQNPCGTVSAMPRFSVVLGSSGESWTVLILLVFAMRE
jgi:hypothetical protein